MKILVTFKILKPKNQQYVFSYIFCIMRSQVVGVHTAARPQW